MEQDYLEPVAPILSDPVYALMVEEGEDVDDIPIIELAQREQLLHKRDWESEFSEPAQQDVSRVINNAVKRTASKLRTMLEQGVCTWAHAFEVIERLGVDHDEAIELLTEDA